MQTFFKTAIISLVLLLAHLLVNIVVSDPIRFTGVVGFQLFYSLTLFLSILYMKKGIKKDISKLWINYMSIVSVKFFLFLAFIFGMKWFFEINKTQALIHVFIWFFIYLFVEVKIILKEIKIIKG